MKKIIVQAEAKNNLHKGSILYFYTEEALTVGQKLILANYGTTIRTTVVITDNSGAAYEAIVVTNEVVVDRRDLTEIM